MWTRRRWRPEGARRVDLETVLREADIVVVICVLTPETRHLIGSAQLRLMRPSAYLINVARGPIVDETALIDGFARRADRRRGNRRVRKGTGGSRKSAVDDGQRNRDPACPVLD